MRTYPNSMPPGAPPVPLLDASFLPAAEDWAVVGALDSYRHDADPDEDRFAGLSFGADSFD